MTPIARFARNPNVLALAMLAASTGASAQSVSEFRLPPATATPTSRAPGPVDSDAPVVRTQPSAAPVVTPSPQSSAPAPSASPTTRVPQPALPPPRPVAKATPTPSPVPSPSTAPTQVPGPVIETTGLPAPQATAPLTSPTAEQTSPFSRSWAVLPASTILIGLALWLLRRRRSVEIEQEADLAATPLAPTPPLRPAAPKPAPAPQAPQPVLEPLAAGVTLGPIALAFEARKLSATIINTTLAYRLFIKNRREEALTGLIVAGDMIAAHAALPVEQQLGTDGQPLELRHEVARLEPGEVRELTGELRLPLTAINPIHSGNSLLFVPLTRLRIEAHGESLLAAWVIGEAPLKAGGGLQPFRLDLGPRVYSQISQRSIDLAG